MISMKFCLILFWCRLKVVQTPEELNDVHMHFLLYYSTLIQKMREKKRTKVQEEQNEQSKPPEEEDDQLIKPAARGGPYAICRKAKLGMSPMQKNFKKFNLSALFESNFLQMDLLNVLV